MRIGITVYNDRVSPLFDAATVLEVFILNDGTIETRETLKLGTTTPLDRADELAQAAIDILICGAVSNPYAQAIRTRGVQLLPFHAGPTDEIIDAFSKNRLETRRYKMPGCGRRRHRHGRHFKYRNNF